MVCLLHCFCLGAYLWYYDDNRDGCNELLLVGGDANIEGSMQTVYNK